MKPVTVKSDTPPGELIFTDSAIFAIVDWIEAEASKRVEESSYEKNL